MRLISFLLFALLAAPALGQTHKHFLPFVPSAESAQQGFVRVINQSTRAGSVNVYATDDTGARRGPYRIGLSANQARHLNSGTLEDAVGNGSGHWWLELHTELDVKALAYVRTPDGFLTEMHSVVPRGEDGRYRVPFFNPASNQNQVSRLRIVNPHPERVALTIRAVDDEGMHEREPVRFAIPAGAARAYTSSGLESRFGDGEGKWRLVVSGTKPVWVMNLMTTLSGHITNLSLPAPDLAMAEPEPPPPPPPPPEADRAPANTAALYSLVRGKKVVVSVNNTPVEEYRFTSTTRFTGRDLATGFGAGGRWTYTKGPRHQGTIRFDFDRVQGVDVGSCSAELIFSTRTSGHFSAFCTGLVLGGDGSFRITSLF